MLGVVEKDGAHPSSESVTMRAPFEMRNEILRNRLVRIEDTDVGKNYLGRISAGPFFPRRLNKRSDGCPGEPAVLAEIEIQGELQTNRVRDTSSRPAPGAKVTTLTDVGGLIGCNGDLVMGTLVGQTVPLCLSSTDKAVLPRNIGIFGTVGSGKSNTCQVLIEEASRAGWAVIVIDVEGEYTHMDLPAEPISPHTLIRLEREPVGLTNLAVYHPCSCPGERDDATVFTLRLADFDGPVIAEVLEATQAERNALFDAIDHYRSRNRQRIAVNEREELAGLLDNSPGAKMPFNLYMLRERCVERSSRSTPELDFVGLGAKLLRLMHSQTFDDPNKPPLDISKLITPGNVSIMDVSAGSEVIQNLVTADVLRKAFAHKMVYPNAPPTLLIIEEAHAFISKERAASLHATLEMLRTVTRRGRKRWLSICFVSQQPGHLPNEIFELCNTRIVHNLRSTHNLEALMNSAGDVSQALWNHCPLLGSGEALVSSPQFRRPVIAQIRLASSQRRFTR